jgi:hypothetical protein
MAAFLKICVEQREEKTFELFINEINLIKIQ